MLPVYLSMIEDEESKRSFEELFYKQKDRIISICKKYLTRRVDIEDACSATFFNLAKVFDRIRDIAPDELDRYIYVIAKNAALQILNKEKNEMKNVSLDDIKDTITTDELEQASSGILDKYIEKLSNSEKEILYLRITSELDYKTIAAMLNIKPNAARVRFMRAKQHLSELLKGENKNG